MRKLETVETPFNRVEVWQNNAGRIDLEVSGATHATWHPDLFLTGHAWDAITAATISHPGEIRSLLLLGLGGGTCLRQLRVLLPHATFVAVEIDPEMIGLARTYMDIDALGVEIIEEDAFAHLAQEPRKFDLIIDDIYHAIGDDVERPCPITTETLQDHLRHLTPEGSLVMNFVIGPGHQERFEEARSTFHTTFPQARRVIPPLSYNEVLIGSHHPAPLYPPSKLHAFADHFPEKSDQEHWKELRTLKLRS